MNFIPILRHWFSIPFRVNQLGNNQSIFIYTALGNNSNWSLSTDVSWLTPSILNGVTEGTIDVGVNTSGLATGLHTGNITIVPVQSTISPITVPVTLIINPDVPVKTATWKDGIDGAMSVTVDDGYGSGFEELQSNGFQGTYVCNGTSPPSFYTDFYNAGMELGSHLANHPC